MSHHYVPEQARGVRFDDPAFGIDWPRPDPIVSDRDRQFPDFRP
jgi:dTDP-4-dehydrorhamnose 3,5-epimerase